MYECGSCGGNETAYRSIDNRNDAPVHCGKAMSKIITAPMVSVDNYEYQSPVSGKVIRGKRQRTEDLKRNRCRPWEGLEVEKREAKKTRDSADAKLEVSFEKGVHEVLNNMDADKQRAIKTAHLPP